MGLSRSELVHKLNASTQGTLTTLTAPAGFGKSSLLAEWIEESAWPVCWLSLDERDNDVVVFLRYLISSLQSYRPNLGTSTQEALQAPEPPNALTIMRFLVNELAELQEDLVLVLDDFHLIDNAIILDAFDFFIEHAPPQVHFCVSSRTQLPFTSARRRAGNALAEFGVQQLSFTELECAQFLRETMQLALSESEVQRLYDQTEGWPAGLQLAALARRSLTTPADESEQDEYLEAYRGEQRHIFEYLAVEVLEHEPEGVRLLLLQTSVLDQFNAALCETITEDQAAGQIIKELVRRNLFTVALDHKEHWFRYHHLFREFLLTRLQEHHPAQKTLAHSRASLWYLENDYLELGIKHGLAAGDFEQVAQVIQAHADSMWTFQETLSLRRWLNQLPEDTLQAFPRLQLYDAWTHIMTGNLPEATQALATAEQIIRQDPERWGDLIGVFSTVRATLLVQQGDPQAIALYQHAYDTLPPEATNWLGAVHLGLGMAQVYRGQPAEAIEWLDSGIDLNLKIGNLWAAMYALYFLGQAQIAQGELEAAEATYRRGMQLTSQGAASLSVWSHLGLAEVAILRQDLEEGSMQALEAIRLGKQRDSHENIVRGSLLLAKIEAAQGRQQAVEELIQQAAEYAQSPGIPDMRAFVQNKKKEILVQLESAQQTADDKSGRSGQALIEPLSQTEIALLHLLAEGQSNEDIAATRVISINTVKWHLKNIYGKLGVKNRTGAVAEAQRLGLIA